MRRVVPTLVAALAVSAACATTPKPLGEALVVVQTDVGVPLRVNRVRVDIVSTSDAVIDTREVITPSSEDWPVSFSVVLPDGSPEADVIVRLRAFPEGYQLPTRELEKLAHGEARHVTVHATIDEACASAPPLRPVEPLTLRRGSRQITTLLQTQGCTKQTVSGSAVARLEIAEAGDYEIAIARAVPDAANAEPGSDTAISLRTDCRFPTTQIACAEPLSTTNRLSRIARVTLAPGTYYVVTGGADPAPADLTLLVSRLDVFQSGPSTPPAVSGGNALAPPPGVTIDRLVGLHLRPGERGTVNVALHGECFGTPSDLPARTTCVDTAGQRVPVLAEPPRGRPTREAAPLPPWPGDAKQPCTAAPRDGEVCVPGGAFVLGDNLALEDLDRRSQPARVRVLEPFLVDRFEMSVGRFRDALARGFVPPDTTPVANPAAALTRADLGGMCTFSAAPLGREGYPLTCVTWVTAHALCNFLEGDLPTEDQWEMAARSAGKQDETPYPWGRDLPTCDRTVFGRTTLPAAPCPTAPLGPVPVADALLVNGDTTPLGIVGLAGNVEELLSTGFVPYGDAAWARAGLRGKLDEAEAPLRAARGADWSVGSLYATASTRRSEPVIAAYDNVGFRCARAGR